MYTVLLKKVDAESPFLLVVMGRFAIFIGRLIGGLQLLYMQHANAVIEQNQLQNCMT